MATTEATTKAVSEADIQADTSTGTQADTQAERIQAQDLETPPSRRNRRRTPKLRRNEGAASTA